MTRATLVLALVVIGTLTVSGCANKSGTGIDDDQVQNLGTMSAKVEGRSWTASDPQGHTTAFANMLIAPSGERTFHLVGPCWGAHDTLGCVIFMDVHQPAEAPFALGDYHTAFWHVTRRAGADTLSGVWMTNSNHGGLVTITRLDTLNHKATGTFSFTAFRPDSATTVEVTDGRFDVSYELQHTP